MRPAGSPLPVHGFEFSEVERGVRVTQKKKQTFSVWGLELGVSGGELWCGSPPSWPALCSRVCEREREKARERTRESERDRARERERE